MRSGGGRGVAALGVAAAIALSAAACSGSDGDGATTSTTEPTEITAGPLPMAAVVVDEHDVDGNYRQGIARLDDRWLFTTNGALYVTDDAYAQQSANTAAIPADLAAAGGWDHIGDPDVAGGVIWAPIERPDKESGRQLIATYDPQTLELVASEEVDQHHAAWVSVDDGVLYSADEFSDDAITRYRVLDEAEAAAEGRLLEPMDPLELSTTVERIQGGDVLDGVLYLSTDDVRNGVHAVDLDTGEVHELGSAGHVAGEGEGIDATSIGDAQLHVLVMDEAIAPAWVVDLELEG